MAIDLHAEFELLSREPVPPEGLLVRDVAPGVAIGRDATCPRMLLVDVGADRVVVRDRSSAGVWLTSIPPVEGRRRIALECRDPRLVGVFTALAREVLEAVEDEPLQGRRSVVQGHLARWRELLARRSPERMSTEAEVGLHGELAVLRRFAAVDPNTALDAWVGPKEGQHDFRWADRAVEVKTSRARDGFSVTVHGLRQLEEPGDGARLHLAGVRAIEDPDGTTLPDLVDALLPLVDQTRFLELLALTGYDHATARDHGWLQLRQDRVDLWRVDGATPALRSTMLQPAWTAAISEVRYRLDLGALGEPMAEAEVDELWRV